MTRGSSIGDWTGVECDCGHVKASHKDKGGNTTWSVLYAGPEECGVGSCFDQGCKCKVFGVFGDDVKEIREKERKKRKEKA